MGVYAAGALVSLSSPTEQRIVLKWGAQFALGWWFFLDASILSAHAKPPIDAPFEDVPTHVRFADWIPGLFSSLGMIIVNLIDKTKLVGEDDGFTSGRFGMGGVAWKARLFLFLGFALMAGGLAGSVVRPFRLLSIRRQ